MRADNQRAPCCSLGSWSSLLTTRLSSVLRVWPWWPVAVQAPQRELQKLKSLFPLPQQWELEWSEALQERPLELKPLSQKAVTHRATSEPKEVCLEELQPLDTQ